MTQYRPGNKFIIPVTTGGCSAIRNKMALIKEKGYMPSTFSYAPASNKYPIEIALIYPNIDIVGDMVKSGNERLTLRRNGTNQIIVE